MGFFRIVGLVLTVAFFLLSLVDGAAHGYKHHHADKVIARATTSTLPLTTVTPAGDGSFLQGPATPCSGSVCATAVPNSATMCPASNQTTWTNSSTAQDYNVICDIDFPAQNIYPFVLAGSFEACMAQCETFNAKNTHDNIRCEGFVFAPERVRFSDDCYLKSSLDRPSSATISLVGATAMHLFSSAATPVGKASGMSMYLRPLNHLLC